MFICLITKDLLFVVTMGVFMDMRTKLKMAEEDNVSGKQTENPGNFLMMLKEIAHYCPVQDHLKSFTMKNRSSRPEVLCQKGVLRNFTKFTGKHLCQSLYFNKVAGFKKRPWHSCFPVNFSKF